MAQVNPSVYIPQGGVRINPAPSPGSVSSSNAKTSGVATPGTIVAAGYYIDSRTGQILPVNNVVSEQVVSQNNNPIAGQPFGSGVVAPGYRVNPKTGVVEKIPVEKKPSALQNYLLAGTKTESLVDRLARDTTKPSVDFLKADTKTSQPLISQLVKAENERPKDYLGDAVSFFRGGAKGVAEGIRETGEGLKFIGEESKREAIAFTGIKPKQALSFENIGVSGIAIPIIAKNVLTATGAAALKAISNPQETLTGTLQAAVNNPAKFGTQLGINLLAFKGVGSIAGGSIARVSVLGKSKGFIASEKIVVPEVASGAKNFPTARGSVDALKKFNKETFNIIGDKKVVLSASDYPFTPIVGRTIAVSSGRGLVKGVDVPGLYTSTRGVSTYFLRLKQGLGEYKLLPGSVKELLPSAPKILAVSQVPSRIPVAFRSSLAKAQSFFGKEGMKLTAPKGVSGKPYLSPALEFGLKNEAEAVIQVGSKLKRVGLNTTWEKITGFSKYTKIDGRIVPIYELEVAGKGAVKTGLVESVEVSKYGSYSSGVASRSLVSPSSVGAVVSVPSSRVSSLSRVSLPSKIVSSSVKSSVSVPKIISYPKPSSSRVVSSSRVGSYVLPSVSSYSPSVSSSVSVPSYVPSVRSSIVSKKILSVPSYSSKSKKYIPSVYVPSYVPKVSSYLPTRPSYNLKRVSSKISSGSPRISQGYSVFSRVRGKKLLLGYNLPKNLAIKVGAGFAAGTTARSVKIKPVGFAVGSDIALPSLSQFRLPKPRGRVAREGFTLVEKSRFAIDTLGEKMQLRAGRKGRKKRK